MEECLLVSMIPDINELSILSKISVIPKVLSFWFYFSFYVIPKEDFSSGIRPAQLHPRSYYSGTVLSIKWKVR
jgi:hypothetical protein